MTNQLVGTLQQPGRVQPWSTPLDFWAALLKFSDNPGCISRQHDIINGNLEKCLCGDWRHLLLFFSAN